MILINRASDTSKCRSDTFIPSKYNFICLIIAILSLIYRLNLCHQVNDVLFLQLIYFYQSSVYNISLPFYRLILGVHQVDPPPGLICHVFLLLSAVYLYAHKRSLASCTYYLLPLKCYHLTNQHDYLESDSFLVKSPAVTDTFAFSFSS